MISCSADDATAGVIVATLVTSIAAAVRAHQAAKIAARAEDHAKIRAQIAAYSGHRRREFP